MSIYSVSLIHIGSRAVPQKDVVHSISIQTYIRRHVFRAGHDGDVSTDAEASVSTLDLGGGGRFLGRAQPFTKSDRNREEASP